MSIKEYQRLSESIRAYQRVSENIKSTIFSDRQKTRESERESERERERRTDGRTDGRTNEQTDRQTDKWTGKPTNWKAIINEWYTTAVNVNTNRQILMGPNGTPPPTHTKMPINLIVHDLVNTLT